MIVIFFLKLGTFFINYFGKLDTLINTLAYNHFDILRGDQEGLFKLVTLNYILNRITGVTFGC
jgi:hypothetical protein